MKTGYRYTSHTGASASFSGAHAFVPRTGVTQYKKKAWWPKLAMMLVSLSLYGSACAPSSGVQSAEKAEHAEGEPISAAITRVQDDINASGLADRTRAPSKDEVMAWAESTLLHNTYPSDRPALKEIFSRGHFPQGWELNLVKDAGPHLDHATFIVVNYPSPVVIEGWNNDLEGRMIIGNEFQSIWRHAEYECAELEGAVDNCNELLQDTRRLASTLPDHLEVRVEETALRVPNENLLGYEPGSTRPVLKVELKLTPSNREGVIDYFAFGYGRSAVSGAVQRFYDEQNAAPSDELWVPLERFLLGWPGRLAHTFPYTGILDIEDDDLLGFGRQNDVCYGAARQFFSERLRNDRSFDRSSSSLEWIMSRNYCHKYASDEPEFGDILYKPVHHAGRFVMKVPNTHDTHPGRWIVFSVYSGFDRPYRFSFADRDNMIWTDSDTSFDPEPAEWDWREGFRNSFDVWSYCGDTKPHPNDTNIDLVEWPRAAGTTSN